MRKSRVLAVAGVALSLLAVAACGGGEDGAGGKAEISYLTFETPALTASFWDKAIAEAAKGVPDLTVKRLVSPTADRNAYAKQLQASGQLPDVMAGINVNEFVQADLLVPFGEQWLQDTFLFPDGAALKGKTYSPPTGAQIFPLVYYNKKIFADAGVEVPTTWAEFKDAVVKLRAAGVTPIEMAGAEPWSAEIPIMATLAADVLGSDPDWIQKRYAGSVKFTDPNVVAAVQKVVDLIDMGAFDKNALGVKYADANNEFLAGKSAMYIMGSWLNGVITEDVASDFGAFPFPSNSGKVVIPFVIGGSVTVASTSKHPKQAMAFAEAFASSADNVKALVEGDGLFPLLKGVTLESMGAKVTQLFDDTYKYVTDDNLKVAAFGATADDNAFPPGVGEPLSAMSQKMFSDKNIEAQLAAVDAAWDKAVAAQ